MHDPESARAAVARGHVHPWSRLPALAVVALALSWGCSPPEAGSRYEPGTDDSLGAPGEGDGEPTAGDADPGDPDPADGIGGVGSGEGDALACRRVDLLFAVDDSGSMQEEQAAMRTTIFPAFATRLLAELETLDDFRAAVVDACPSPSTFHTRGEPGACHFEGGASWMESSSSNLVEEFACVGEIYSDDMLCSGSNDDEQPASAAAAALEPPVYAPGGPNAGFLRSDAVLVVIAMTDEDEQPVPEESAQEVYARLVAIKGGDVRRIVFLGIGGASDCDDGFYGKAKEATTLKALTQLFVDQGRGVFWDLCAGALEDGLGQALAVIQSACDELPPPACPPDTVACGEGGVDPAACPSGTYCVSGCCLPWIQ